MEPAGPRVWVLPIGHGLLKRIPVNAHRYSMRYCSSILLIDCVQNAPRVQFAHFSDFNNAFHPVILKIYGKGFEKEFKKREISKNVNFS